MKFRIDPPVFSFLFLVLTFYICSTRLTAQTSDPPNVVIILADDMGYGDVSALNPAARTRTPHIDQLVNEGMTFTDAHASASVCTPSRYGLLTGRYAWRQEGTGVVNGFQGSVMDPDRQTLGDIFQQAGYATACIGKWHLGVGWQTHDGQSAAQDPKTGRSNVDFSLPITVGPGDFGFEYSFIHPASLDMPPYLFLENHKAVDPNMLLTDQVYRAEKADTEYAWDKKHTKDGDVYWGKGVWWRRGEIAETFRIVSCLPEIANQSTDFLRRHRFLRGTIPAHQDQPFFLYLPLTAPHTPWMVTPEFQDQTPIGDYGDFVLQVDDVVGQVVHALKEMGEWENTILVFSSDNGAYWPETEIEIQRHDSHAVRRGQKGDIWEGGHRVPLVISWPAQIDEKRIYGGLTSLTDFFATFREMLGQSTQAGQGEDSQSFWSALTDTDVQGHRTSMVHQSSRGMFAFRENDWKYIDGLGSGGFTAPVLVEAGTGEPEGQLYRLSTDSRESNNLYLSESRRVNQMKKALERVKNAR